MARGPQGQYRPTDPIASAVLVAQIATGETTEWEVASKAASRQRKPGSRKGSKTLHDEF